MNIQLILSAFGGGVLGTALGALPAFIFTGFIGLIGIAVIAAGGQPAILNDVTFGTLLGPHIAFAGGVAAAAFAANKRKHLDTGLDIVTSLNKCKDPMVLMVGGFFGIIGFLLNNLFVAMKIPTDTVALTVFVSGLIARMAFGKTGVFGKLSKPNEQKRKIAPDFNDIVLDIIIGLSLGLVISYLIILTEITTLGFCISAASLIFVQMGFEAPTTHHITMVAGYAAVATGNMFVGALAAVIASILGDLVGRIVNSYCDTHIDPPATTIFICSLVIFMIF
ncbi:hypothetical protein [Maledivibacter halophilus]|uniref:DUF7973 domain-containing protein n=1 Tax=Maledivibacter halophilus TaxID=36842 RepID=A0A1T5MUJ1_9FIRM|nr:hypothetical protein [Maledivibacter halophilus]SKC91900.1 hypothetical protein SAMN02194393_05401 [Maledivibacter halophilus]